MENKNKNKLYLIIMFTLVLIILDQLLKFYIPNVIHEQSIPIIENILQFTYKQNTGGAYQYCDNKYNYTRYCN
jgi:lipoprotein signal peptidase